MPKPHEAWLACARDDLAFARSGLKDGFHAHVCFLAQQAAEKAMKGFLVFQGKPYPKSHGLVTLHRLMQIGWLDAHISALKKLSEYYVPIRYPDAAAGILTEGTPSKENAEEALRWAEEIVSLIEDNLKV